MGSNCRIPSGTQSSVTRGAIWHQDAGSSTAHAPGTFSPPSPTAVQPPSPCRSLFVLNVSLLVREKQKIPQNSCLHPLSRKMGQFTAAIVRRISCLGVWKLPRVESSRQPARPLLSLAQITTKTATATATTTTKHATWAPAHTNTPTEPNRRDEASGRSLWAVHSGGRHILWPGATAAPLPAPRPSVSDGKRADTGRRLTRSKCRRRENKATAGSGRRWLGLWQKLTKAGKFKLKICPEDPQLWGLGCGRMGDTGGDEGTRWCRDGGWHRYGGWQSVETLVWYS